MLSLPVLLLSALVLGQEPPSQPEYYLRSQGEYVAGYHIGAGLDDAVLVSDKSVAAKGYLNDTNQQFDLGTTFPWGMVMTSNPAYSGRMTFKLGRRSVQLAPLLHIFSRRG